MPRNSRCLNCKTRTRFGKSKYCRVCLKGLRRVLHRAHARLRRKDPEKKAREDEAKRRNRARIKTDQRCVSCGEPIGSNLGSKYCDVCRPVR